MASQNEWKKGQRIGRVYVPLEDVGEPVLVLEVVAEGGSDANGLPLCEYRFPVPETTRVSYILQKLNAIVQNGRKNS